MTGSDATKGSNSTPGSDTLEPWLRPEVVRWLMCLVASWDAVCSEPLLPRGLHPGGVAPRPDIALAAALYDAPFVLLSHGTEDDPLFNYGNRLACDLFRMSWDTLRGMPSRLSAEPDQRAERQDSLRRALEGGVIRDYSGVRIAADGTRFLINGATIWSVVDERGQRIGQAARFDSWQPIG